MQSIDSPVDLVKQFLANFEKRQRNLVKRKSKLDSYKEKLARGEVLNDEQKKAVAGYEGVVTSISLMQEMASQSKELLNAIEKSSVVERSKVEIEIEERTVSFLQISTCIQRFLSMLDIPSVRDAVIKSTSESNLKLLDLLRSTITAPLVDNLPGSSSTALGDIPSHLQSREDIKAISQNLYNLVIGRPVPIPMSNAGDVPKKHANFKDARNLCFRLMANPVVQRSMGVTVPTECAQTPVDAAYIQNASNDSSESNEKHAAELKEQFRIQGPKIVHDANQCFPQQPNSFIDVSAEPVLDHIKPIANTFNFLQASRVEVPLPEEPINYSENLMVADPEDNGVNEFNGGSCETELNSSPHSIDKHKISGIIDGEILENDIHSSNFVSEEPVGTVEHVSQAVSKPGSTVEVEVAPISSKPISYADSVRKISFSGPVPQRVLNEPQIPNKKMEKSKDDRGDQPHQTMRNGYSRGGPYRGRPNNSDGRGDRGAVRRGFGPRAQTHYGRNGAPRAMSHEIAQPTY